MAEFEVQEIAYKKDFDGYKNGMSHYQQEALRISTRAKELWEKSANLDLQVLDGQKENAEIKAKLEALNETSRNELAKKNAEIEQLQKTQPENAKLLKENGTLSAKIQVLESDLIASREKFDALKEIETGLNSEVSALKKVNEKLNDSLLASERLLKELNLQKGSLNLQVSAFKKSEADLRNSLEVLSGENIFLKKNNEILKTVGNDLKNENMILKNKIAAKNGKMNSFKTVVIFLAVLANFLLLGKKFMGLTGEKDWQTYLISYGSVLIFDLTVIFLTMVNRSKEALYFGIGVFILTFFQIGKPFLGLSLDIAFYGFNLLYFERIISGCIYSFFFAFLSYFLSKIEIKS